MKKYSNLQNFIRYELFRRSCFPRNQIKRLMQQVSGQAVNQQVCIAMSGVAKVFVGELVEEALKVAVSIIFQENDCRNNCQ